MTNPLPSPALYLPMPEPFMVTEHAQHITPVEKKTSNRPDEKAIAI